MPATPTPAALAREAIHVIGQIAQQPGADYCKIYTVHAPDAPVDPGGHNLISLTLGHLRALANVLGHLASDDVQELGNGHTFHPQGANGAGGIRDDEGDFIAAVANVEQAIGYVRGLNDGFSRGRRVGRVELQRELRRLQGIPEPDGMQRQIDDLERRMERLETRGEK